MKKKLIFLIVISIQQLIFPQTKQETSDWLLEKINDNSEVNDGTFREYFYYIENGNIFKKTSIKTFNVNQIFGIPIKSIKKIIVYKDKLCFNFDLFCESNCVNEQINNEIGKKEEKAQKSLEIPINNEDSTLYERIPKSLIHLIKLYGGNPQLVVKNEPF